MASNIYYHFFDRELRESVNSRITDEIILEVLCCSIFMTDELFYLPISNLYESSIDFPSSLDYVRKMDQLGLIYPASSHSSREGFLLSRQEMYQHDKKRYPMYFEEKYIGWSSHLIKLPNSTTKILQAEFLDNEIIIPELETKSRNKLRGHIEEIMQKLSGRAITSALFRPECLNNMLTDQEIRTSIQYIRQKISEYYIRRYLDVMKGTIITGIPDIEKYDYIAESPDENNFKVYSFILKSCGVDFKQPHMREFILEVRNSVVDFQGIYMEITKIVSGINRYAAQFPYGRERKIKDLMKADKKYVKIDTAWDLYRNLVEFWDDICKKNKNLKELINMEVMDKGGIAVVAVNATEMIALLNNVRRYFPNYIIKEIIDDRLIYRELLGGRKPLYIIQSQMGMAGTGSIINTMHLIREVLKPEMVILGGVAFGANSEKQKVGDILVAKQVWYYEAAKVTDSQTISRGDKMPASSYLLQLFNSTALEYTKTTVHFGLMASGEKLVNSDEFLSDLRSSEPEFIGGDMEAAGLCSVCCSEKIDWIVVKAICDWGVKKTDNYQSEAADNAFDFIMQNLRKLI